VNDRSARRQRDVRLREGAALRPGRRNSSLHSNGSDPVYADKTNKIPVLKIKEHYDRNGFCKGA